MKRLALLLVGGAGGAVCPAVVGAAVVGAAGAGAAEVGQPEENQKDLVKVSIVARESKVKAGETLQVGVVLEIAKGWHVYWPGQNDSGTPTLVTLEFPAGSGFTAGAAVFPVPKRHVLPGEILDYVHEGKLVVTVPVKVPATAKVGQTVKITANVEYLVCKESCIPGDASVSATVVVAEKSEGAASSVALIDGAVAAQAKGQGEGFEGAVAVKWEGETLVVTAMGEGATAPTSRAAFYPLEGSAKLVNDLRGGEVKGGALRLEFEPGLKPVAGVVELTAGGKARAWTVRIDRPGAAKPAADSKPGDVAKPAGR